jgi:hypothetical protein
VELYQKIIQLQTETMEVQEEVRPLREQFRAGQEALRFEGTLEFRDNVYWGKGEGGSEDGPYCSRCWDATRQAVRLHQDRATMWKCPECGRGAREGGRGIGTVSIARG